MTAHVVVEARRTIELLLLTLGGWFVIFLFSTLFGLSNGTESARGPLLNGAITTLLLTGAQLGLVRYLFQLHQRGTPEADPR